MGIIQHNVVIASTSDPEKVELLRAWIAELDPRERELLVENDAVLSNELYTFVLTPDGSKEGWDNSVWGDKLRARFIAWLRASPGWAWIAAGYGELGSKIDAEA